MLRKEQLFDVKKSDEYKAIKVFFEEFYKNRPEIINEFETLGFEVTSSEAQLFLGLLYDSAQFRNEAKAAEFFKKAAEQGAERSAYAKELFIACQQKQYLDNGRLLFDTLQEKKSTENQSDLESKENYISHVNSAAASSLIDNYLSDKRMTNKYFVPLFKTREAHQLTLVNRNFNCLFKDSMQAIREQLQMLLRYVSMGYQNGAEDILKKNPDLLLMKGEFTDPFGRYFSGISAFQYAVWARDRHMWDMIRQYLPNETAKHQLEELETKGTEHEKYFDFSRLINAMKFYIKNYDNWMKNNDVEGCANYLVKEIGGAQRHSVAHLFNEYCNNQPFYPCPSFDEKELRRDVHCFPKVSNLLLIPLVQGMGVGAQFCLWRSSSVRVLGGRKAFIDESWETPLIIVKEDLAAIIALQQQRARDITLLKHDLHIQEHEVTEPKSKCLVM